MIVDNERIKKCSFGILSPIDLQGLKIMAKPFDEIIDLIVSTFWRRFSAFKNAAAKLRKKRGISTRVLNLDNLLLQETSIRGLKCI